MKLAEQLIEFFSGFYGANAYAAILTALLICGLGIPIPEDITLISAGILASMGNISLSGAMISGFVGVLLGDTFLFFLGYKMGNRVYKLPGFRRVFTPERIEAAKKRVQKEARIICFVARFLPGLRAAVYLTAGTMHVKPSTFFVQDGMAAAISVPIWVYIGYLFGENLDYLLAIAKKLNYYIFAMIFVIVAIYAYLAFRRRHHNNS